MNASTIHPGSQARKLEKSLLSTSYSTLSTSVTFKRSSQLRYEIHKISGKLLWEKQIIKERITIQATHTHTQHCSLILLSYSYYPQFFPLIQIS